MSNIKLKIPPEFGRAPSEERIAFVQDLWDQIAQEPDKVQLPEQHKRILANRLAVYRTNPHDGKPWSEVRDHLLAQLRTR